MTGYKELMELVKSVQASGILDTHEEKIVEYQDMIGHSSEEELDELSRSQYRAAFYRVYDLSYGTAETLKFYFNHSETIRRIMEEKAGLEADRDKYQFIIQDLNSKIEKAHDQAEKMREAWEEAEKKRKEEGGRITELEAENQALKAKLYDLMTA